MAYHSDFWLIMGTSGPVILLSHVVSLARSARSLPAMGPKTTREYIEHGMPSMKLPPRRERKARLGQLSKAQRRRLRIALLVIGAPAITSAAGVILAAGPTLLAFDCLQAERDTHSLGLAKVCLAFSVLLLVFEVILGDIARTRIPELRHPGTEWLVTPHRPKPGPRRPSTS